ncbi:hypothetical protein ACFL0V_01175 [Nanoarchaeota archaeon]
MSSHGTTHTLRALEEANTLRRLLRRDDFTMNVEGVDYKVSYDGGNTHLEEYTPRHYYSSKDDNDGCVRVGQRLREVPRVVGIGGRLF